MTFFSIANGLAVMAEHGRLKTFEPRGMHTSELANS